MNAIFAENIYRIVQVHDMRLKRAASAPAHYATPGILRYESEPLSTTSYNVKFAPLPETESSGRKRKYKLGVSGRPEILSRQRVTRGAINYNTNNAQSQFDSDSTVQQNGDANVRDPEGATAETDVHPDDDSSVSVSIPELQPRRSASEDGMSAQADSNAANKQASNSWGFWRWHSTRPALQTITLQKEPPLSPIRDVERGGEPPANVSDTDSALIEAAPIIGLDTAMGNSVLTNSPKSVGASSPLSSPPSTPKEEHVSPEEVQVKRLELLEHPEESVITCFDDEVGWILGLTCPTGDISLVLADT